jgi:hypothetical protein
MLPQWQSLAILKLGEHSDIGIADDLKITERTVQNIRARKVRDGRYDVELWELISLHFHLPWGSEANLQILEMIKLIKGKKWQPLERQYGFSAAQSVEHVLKLRESARPEGWTEADWGHTVVAYYFLLGSCFNTYGASGSRREKRLTWKRVAKTFDVMLAPRREPWATALRVKMAVTPLLFAWQDVPDRALRNGPAMRRLVDDLCFFDRIRPLKDLFGAIDRDTPFSALAIASRQQRRDQYEFLDRWLAEAKVNPRDEQEFDDDFDDYALWKKQPW